MLSMKSEQSKKRNQEESKFLHEKVQSFRAGLAAYIRNGRGVVRLSAETSVIADTSRGGSLSSLAKLNLSAADITDTSVACALSVERA